jgi:hypothetical protein
VVFLTSRIQWSALDEETDQGSEDGPGLRASGALILELKE